MAGLFSNGRSSKPEKPATGLRVSSSLYGRPRAICYGQTRVAPNLINYAGFSAKKSTTSGKGGLAGGGKGQGGSYTYSVSAIASLGESINSVLTIYNTDAVDFLVTPSAATLSALSQIGITPTTGNTYNAEIHIGTSTQTASAYWASAFPASALAYRGEAYVVFPNLSLGSSPSFPNFNFEVLGNLNSDVPALGPDANPSDVIADFLTNTVYGVTGFSSALLGDFATAKNYWRATGLLISDCVSNGTAANTYLKDLLTALNAEFRWSNGKLDIVPYGDVAVSGNGASYVPNVTPIYDLTTNDFLPNQGSIGDSTSGTTSVAMTRKDPSEIKNKIQIEYLDRNTLYNPAIVYASDEASIAQTWLRMADKKSCNFFALGSAARTSASLQLHREQAAAMQYQITVGLKYILLEPLDLVTITEPALQLVRQLCRITEIAENSDQSRTLTLEPVPLTAAAPLYGVQTNLGAGRNSNAPAASVNTPIFYEPPDAIGGGLALWIGLCGQDMTNFGGCDVWASSDGATYVLLGTFEGASRMGILKAALPAVAPANSGPTIDSTDVAAVDLTESIASLGNGSQQDMLAMNTAIVVDSEIVSYQNATLTGAYQYGLTPLVRGGFGTAIAAHAAGAPVMRLDGSYFDWDYTSDRVGQTMYFKFLAFNAFGGGKQQLSDVGPYTYRLTGVALASALPSVQNLRGVFEAGVTKVWWDEISDFRPIMYEVRKGATWATAQTVTRLAHPPFVTFGDDTYWVAAVTTPTAGLTIYSASPQSIAVAGALLSQNIVFAVDERASGWPGLATNGLGVQGVGSSGVLALGGAGNILAAASFLGIPDVLNYGGVISSGTYVVGEAHWVDVGYVAQCLIGATFVGTGEPIGQNILSISDFLNQTDVLGTEAARLANISVEIATGNSANTDMFSIADAFAPLDAFKGVPVWGPWQKFVPGVYVARFVKMRLTLSTADPTVTAVCLGFSFQVTVPARIDHYQNLSVPAAGLTIVFQPDSAAAPAPFNGGPDGQALPYLNATWPNQAGDTLNYTVTNSSAFIQFLNGGVGVARSGVNVNVEGY